MEKRTDKHRKKSFGSYYSEYSRWDIKGKSSKEVKEMFLDLKKCLYYNLNRINRLKFVVESFKKEAKKVKKIGVQKEVIKDKNTQLSNLKDRLQRALDREKSLKLEIKNITKELTTEKRRFLKLELKLTELKKEVTALKIKKNRTLVRKVNKPSTRQQQRVQRIIDSGADEKAIRNLEYISRTNRFLKEKGLTLNFFEVLTKAEVLGMLKSKDEGITYSLLEKLTNLGYLEISTAIKGATKYWYLTVKGKDLIKDYKNYLSYGK